MAALLSSLACLAIGAACSGPSYPAYPSSGALGARDAGAELGTWDQTVASAKQEGKIMILGPRSATLRSALSDGFHRRYPEIALDYRPVDPADLRRWAQSSEPRGDLVVAPPGAIVRALLAARAADPIGPYLTGPNASSRDEASDENVDTGCLVFASAAKAPIAYNPALAPPGEIHSWRQLLDARWRGLVGFVDPRRNEEARLTAAFLARTGGLGPDFLRELFATGASLVMSPSEAMQELEQGALAVAIGVDDQLVADARAKGGQIDVLPPDAFDENSYVTAGPSAVSVLTHAPHPEAVRVYLDYLLSPDAQITWESASGFARTQSDPEPDAMEAPRPAPSADVEPRCVAGDVDEEAQLDSLIRSVLA